MNVHNNMSVKTFDDIILCIDAFYETVQRHCKFHLKTTELNHCFTASSATEVLAKPAHNTDAERMGKRVGASMRSLRAMQGRARCWYLHTSPTRTATPALTLQVRH